MIENLTDKERLVISNQFKILSELSEDDYMKEVYLNKATVFSEGYTRYYNEVDLREELNKEQCAFVVSVIELYNTIYYSWEKLPEEEKSQFDEYHIKFHGFDVNSEIQGRFHSFADFMLEDEGKWRGFKENCLLDPGTLNSHGSGPDMKKLQEMIKKYKEVHQPGVLLTSEHIKQIINV